jgi:23S rRNA (guanosine2251-2'-O)-methyltransferase
VSRKGRGRPRERRKPDERGADDLVVGRHAVEAALTFRPEIARHLFTAEPDGDVAERARESAVPVTHEKKPGLDVRAHGLVHQGFVLTTSGFPYAHVEDALAQGVTLALALDGVEDPRNLGAAARAAHAMGAQLVVVPKDRAAKVTASAHKTAAGALFRLQVARADNLKRALEQMKDAGLWIVGAEADSPTRPWEPDLTTPICLVVGGEDRGLRRLTREACDHVVSIPMAASDVSLNAADAATVLLYEVLRQRAVAGA